MILQLPGVQVGAVQPLQAGEQRVMSGIRKQAVRGLVAVGAGGLAVYVPGSLMTGQAFAVVAGPRETPVMELFKAARARGR